MKLANRLSVISLIALILFCLAWELWLAPLRPGGSMLALKTLPLLLPLFGLLHEKRYTHQWVSLFSLLYLAEGCVRIGSDPIGQRWAAGVEIGLALLLFVSCVAYAKLSAKPPSPNPAPAITTTAD